ncbi:hypothetical protein ACV0PV_006525 [Pseudomonas aeruginosa]
MTNPLHDDALVAYYKKQYGVEDKPAPTTAERLKAMIQAKGEDPQYGRLTTAKAAELRRNSLKRLDSDLVVKSLSPVAANITKAFLSTGEELTPTAMTVISQLTLEVSKAAADGIPSTDAEVQALVAKAVANLRGAK